MIIRKASKIEVVDYHIFNSKENQIGDRENKNEKVSNYKLPLEFSFKDHWSINYSCKKCNEKIEIRSDKRNFVILNKMFSRYYLKGILEKISSLFSDLEIYVSKVSKYHFIAHSGNSLEISNDLEIPKATFLYNKCPNCNAEYLSNFKEFVPVHPEKGIEQGLPGKIVINEMINVHTDSGFSLPMFLLKSRL